MRLLLAYAAAAAACCAAELAPGSYECVYAPVGGTSQVMRVQLARDADGSLTATNPNDGEVLRGRQVGERLYLARSLVDQRGIDVLQIIATVGPDDYAAGNAYRSLNAEMLPKLQFILRRVP